MLSDDVERTLQRYRAVDPPTGLQWTVVAATVDVTGRFEWIWGPAVAAAVLASWVGVQLAMAESPRDPIRDEEVAFVAKMLGGDENAAAYAERVVPKTPTQDALPAIEDRWLQN
jgi:hypothetical protein